MPARPRPVPRLKFDVTHKPQHPPPHSHHHHDHHHPHHHHHQCQQHGVKYRRAALDPDYLYRSSRGDPQVIRELTLSTRDTVYGFDRDYLQDYYLTHAGEERRAARVQLYTHDSSDPFSCTCYPRASQKTIPSMMYDQVRCPHPDHQYQPGEQDLFTYPWTSQTYRPHVVLEHGYRQGQITPPSAVTAPPFVLYNPAEPNPKKGQHPPPYSAPEKTLVAPLMPVKPSDRRLRRVNRQRVVPATAATAPLPNLAEEDEEEDGLRPFDSISQQQQRRAAPLTSFRPPSLRLRTVDTPVMGRVDSEMRAKTGMRALSTPHALPPLDMDGFPQTPTRIFKGEYVDTRGQKYQYDIKYGKTILDGKRTRLDTL